jgi:hypothetical protein
LRNFYFFSRNFPHFSGNFYFFLRNPPNFLRNFIFSGLPAPDGDGITRPSGAALI